MLFTPDRPIDPKEEKIDFEVCVICLKDISPYNTNIVDDLGKNIIVCNFCKNKFNLKEI